MKLIAKKKPVEVEVIQYKGINSLTEIIVWCGSKAKYRRVKQQLFIETLEGTLEAKLGDYIVKGVKGEFYPVEKSIFEETYDIVKEK